MTSVLSLSLVTPTRNVTVAQSPELSAALSAVTCEEGERSQPQHTITGRPPTSQAINLSDTFERNAAASPDIKPRVLQPLVTFGAIDTSGSVVRPSYKD